MSQDSVLGCKVSCKLSKAAGSLEGGTRSNETALKTPDSRYASLKTYLGNELVNGRDLYQNDLDGAQIK